MGKFAMLDDEFRPFLTNHASARMGSRHISPAEVAFVMNNGRGYHVRGAVIYVMGRRDLKLFRNNKTITESIKGLQVVCAPDDDVVITVYRNTDFRHLRRKYRKISH